MVDDSGKTESKTAIDYIYSLTEIDEFLKIAGINSIEKYSVPPKKVFTQGDRRAYIIGNKN